MVSPYYSYMQMLIPIVASKANAMADHIAPEITISIFTDNPRPLSDEASMTMRTFLCPKNTAKTCRWSSETDLVGIASLMTKSRSNSEGTPRRSSEDLRSLMTKNSRLPRSTDDLRGAAVSSLKRSSVTTSAASERQNDRWDISNGGRGGCSSNSNKLNHRSNSKKNPFDLSMPGGLPSAHQPGTGTATVTTAGASRFLNNTAPITPRVALSAQSLKIPQRRTSMDRVARPKLKAVLESKGESATGEDQSCSSSLSGASTLSSASSKLATIPPPPPADAANSNKLQCDSPPKPASRSPPWVAAAH